MATPSQQNSASGNPVVRRPTTSVNGIGMYESWKRNFKSPFYAMLDIIDNAIDAGFDRNDESSFDGKVDMYENFTRDPSVNSNALFSRKQGKGCRSELVISNNSIAEICDIDLILEIHSSAKGKNSVSIGENGVGE